MYQELREYAPGVAVCLRQLQLQSGLVKLSDIVRLMQQLYPHDGITREELEPFILATEVLRGCALEID